MNKIILNNFIYSFPANHFEDYAEDCNIKPIKIKYKNWKNEISIRNIYPDEVWYGSTEYHKTLQFLLTAWDIDKQAFRDFALTDILEFIKSEK